MALASRPKLARRLAGIAFAVWCVDGPDAARLRKEHLAGHLSYVERNFERYLVAGPMRRDGETALAGSLFIILAESEREARDFLAGDPYFSSGLFADMIFRRLTPAAGRWMGGVIWERPEDLMAVADGGR